ncbi:hypothetical protein PSH85_25075 [Pseudomonas simiae]|uniref:hypothetical protein n=1 Tax=Pseudomonas simiae TaxID=321846 RepID=UPI0027337770|nr:hypothetical protein [Pseudomonas simiae]WLG33562.1 hypothetical protein PSH82_25040 [Pseudomonas simiae]WLI23535.1 hypothetical protein PSH85_25075 [Pseudomonas simiae]
MRQELAELINRMSVRESVSNSEKSISWQAYREAEVLADTTLVNELDAYLDRKLAKDQRAAAYFIIGKIGRNCPSEECASCLIKYVPLETNKYLLASLLELISDIPKSRSVDVLPLLLHLNDERWLVRHAAIQSLKGCQSAEAEDRLLYLLAKTSDVLRRRLLPGHSQ